MLNGFKFIYMYTNTLSLLVSFARSLNEKFVVYLSLSQCDVIRFSKIQPKWNIST